MGSINIRTMDEIDWALYRDLRLMSLQESPDSFSSTFDEESKYSDAEWKRKLGPNGRAFMALPLVALLGQLPAGIAWGIVHNKNDDVGHLYQMWIKPEYRGHGIGKALLKEIIAWAQKLSLSQLVLGVTESNAVAVNLYESVGFNSSNELTELRPGSSLKLQSMFLNIGAGKAKHRDVMSI